MQDAIIARRKVIVQALKLAHVHAEKLAELSPSEDRLPFEIDCLISEVSNPPSPAEVEQAYLRRCEKKHEFSDGNGNAFKVSVFSPADDSGRGGHHGRR